MADKMKLYAGDEDIDLEELERALTVVRRKMAHPESFPGFLENPEVWDIPTHLFDVSNGRAEGYQCTFASFPGCNCE